MKKKNYGKVDGKNLELESFLLAKIFLQHYKKYEKKSFNISNVSKTKWWKFFYNSVKKFSWKKKWDPYKFIEIQFKEYGKIFPYHLVKKEAWDTFMEFCNRGEINIEKTIAIELLCTYKLILNWSKRKGFPKIEYKKFFENPLTLLQLKRKRYSLYFLVISRSFWDLYKKLTENDRNDILTKDEIIVKRAMIFKHKRILKKIKEVLGEEFR